MFQSSLWAALAPAHYCPPQLHPPPPPSAPAPSALAPMPMTPPITSLLPTMPAGHTPSSAAYSLPPKLVKKITDLEFIDMAELVPDAGNNQRTTLIDVAVSLDELLNGAR